MILVKIKGFLDYNQNKDEDEHMKEELAFLKELTDLRSTSGGENAVRSYLKNKFLKLTDQVETDGLGSLIAYEGKKGPKILAVGHMDEVGFIVRAITKDGYIKIARCGFFFESGALSQHFIINTGQGDVEGICSIGPGYVSKEFPKIENYHPLHLLRK